MNVDDILARLRHDLAAEQPGVAVGLRQIDRPDADAEAVVLITVGGIATREVWLFADRDAGQALAEVADALQDELADEHVVWPTCPGHPHQPAVRHDGDDVWWACPKTSHRLAPIGHLTT